jgi:glycine/D-amino acid oxidase-like deaminating enzyme/nitrite reductase/ring-hydroxylating ferredoxin subunit
MPYTNTAEHDFFMLLGKAETMKRDGSLESLWQGDMSKYSPVNGWNKDEVYDVLIVGGGITGITTALELQKGGKKCIVAEAYNIGFGTTGGTTAHLNTILDTTYPEIESAFSKEIAQQVADATKAAIQTIEAYTLQYDIDCDFAYKAGYLLATDDKQVKMLEDIMDGANRVGIEMKYTKDIPVPIPFEKAASFEGQAQFNIGKYLVGLAKAFESFGGVILQNAIIGEIKTGDIYTAASSVGEIKADNVVYATHLPPGINLLHFRCAPYRSYAAAFTLKGDNYPDALVYDLEDPYHYFRTQEVNGKRYIIGGGFDHKTGHNENTEQVFRELEAYLRQHFEVDTIDYKWSSQYYNSADGLPYIGKLPGYSTIYTATGFIGNGMIYGTLSGKIISDMILGNENPSTEVFASGRIKPIAGFTEFVKENADVVSQFIGKRFAYEKVKELSELANGEACLADWEGKKVALYKDEQGKIHALDPVCPHAKCIVAWNNAEKSWDCPCHGGRYAPNGALLTGPARRGLEQVIIEHIDGD